MLARAPGWYRAVYASIYLLALGLAYFALAKFGLALASLHPSASPIWPPSGLALAAFLLWGNRVWPAIAAGAFLANATTFGSISSSAGIAVGNTLEAFVTAWLLNKWSGGSATFDTPGRVARFAGLALAPGTMISATMGVTSLVVAGYADAADFTHIWTTWWLGDIGGQLLIAPVIVLWAKSGPFPPEGGELRRLAGLFAGTGAVGLIAFSPLVEQTAIRGSMAFLAIAPMLWAALRHNQRDTATAALVLSCFAIWGALASGGPFARPSVNDSFLLVLTFVISTAVPSLVLSADVALRRRSEAELADFFDYGPVALHWVGPDGKILRANRRELAMLGYDHDDYVGRNITEFHVSQAAVGDILKRLSVGEASENFEAELRCKDGSTRHVLISSSVLWENRRFVHTRCFTSDITERKEAEARQFLLVRELQHRTKNMLAVVQSIVSNTLKRGGDPKGMKNAILGRLHALARAQEFVASGPSGGAPLRDLVDAELSPFTARARLEGKAIVVGGAFAQTFALIIHELATNAVKHGSLSSPNGHVLIAWRIDRSRNEPHLSFSWVERGGPAPAAPEVPGFGAQLIALLGNPRVSYGAQGFEYQVDVPLSEVMKESN